MGLEGKSILVTGYGGFVGQNLAEELKRRGAKVLGLTDHAGRRIDVRDWQGVSRQIGNVDIVYHLVAKTYVPSSWENPRDTYDVNVLGTLNILELCRLRKVERIVFASSYVYGQPQYLPVDEKHPLNPTNPYANSKVLAEGLCRAYHEDYGLKCMILRVFNIYGEGQNKKFLIPTILNQLADRKIELADPEPRRDLLHVSDAVDAYIKAGEYAGSGFEIFNIGSGTSYTIDEIVRKILSISQQDVEVNYRYQRRKNEIMDVVADIKKAREKLNWGPKVTVSEGLKRCIYAQGFLLSH